MSMPTSGSRRWRKSGFSGGDDNVDCVEIALSPNDTAVRDSKNAAGAVLDFPSGAWHSFIDAITGAPVH
jgi:hypothetical protein